MRSLLKVLAVMAGLMLISNAQVHAEGSEDILTNEVSIECPISNGDTLEVIDEDVEFLKFAELATRVVTATFKFIKIVTTGSGGPGGPCIVVIGDNATVNGNINCNGGNGGDGGDGGGENPRPQFRDNTSFEKMPYLGVEKLIPLGKVEDVTFESDETYMIFRYDKYGELTDVFLKGKYANAVFNIPEGLQVKPKGEGTQAVTFKNTKMTRFKRYSELENTARSPVKIKN